jgi:hypothetical protein
MTKIQEAALKALVESAAWETLVEEYKIDTPVQLLCAQGLMNAVLRVALPHEYRDSHDGG